MRLPTTWQQYIVSTNTGFFNLFMFCMAGLLKVLVMNHIRKICNIASHQISFGITFISAVLHKYSHSHKTMHEKYIK